ncbi:hypothetical protein PYJP_15750 [Pyrofollis japonicus]|uniref:hypothetical protein n=1 Tax=Pyrofollis japonicus TaxID=3060460 RepID=UPI00295BEE96|nr:hypothetical protein [Pyrofollis japonicus]BEP18223.1 hypothetical protein PYJP_15750 [Pyrofollis japonicus]
MTEIMKKPRLSLTKYFTIPYTVFEALMQMRGAIDPDSGQIVCHFLDLGVTALDLDGSSIPLIVIDGCLFATFGRENVETIVERGGAVEISSLNVNKGRILFGDVEIDNYWGPIALAFAAETASPVKMFKIYLDVDGKEAPIAAILVENTEAGPMLMLIPRSCEYVEESEQRGLTHM